MMTEFLKYQIYVKLVDNSKAIIAFRSWPSKTISINIESKIFFGSEVLDLSKIRPEAKKEIIRLLENNISNGNPIPNDKDFNDVLENYDASLWVVIYEEDINPDIMMSLMS